MGTPQYIISSLMLEEHRHNVERNMPNPDWPDPVPASHSSWFTGLRKRASDMLRSVAARLEPSDRSWNSEPMR